MFPAMDSLEQKILAEFDGPGARTLSGLGDAAIVKDAASHLVSSADAAALTHESARHVRAPKTDGCNCAAPRDVTIYSLPGCHLCEEAKEQIAPMLKEFGARLHRN